MVGLAILGFIGLLLCTEKIIDRVCRWRALRRDAHGTVVDAVKQADAEVKFLDITESWDDLEPDVQSTIRTRHHYLLRALLAHDKRSAAIVADQILTMLARIRPCDIVDRRSGASGIETA